MKLFHILTGVLQGLTNSRVLNVFLDWLYPNYFSMIIEGTLNAFYEDDEVVQTTFRFLKELVMSRNGRMKYQNQSINELIIFKETAKYVVQLLQLWDCFNSKAKKIDDYKKKWKPLKIICGLYFNIITGNYINFAVCEYYNDCIFSDLSQMVFIAMTSQDYNQLLSYKKVHKVAFEALHHFFKHHLEMMFLKFNGDLIEKMLMLLVHGTEESSYDIQLESCSCINSFNEYVFNKLRQ